MMTIWLSRGIFTASGFLLGAITAWYLLESSNVKTFSSLQPFPPEQRDYSGSKLQPQFSAISDGRSLAEQVEAILEPHSPQGDLSTLLAENIRVLCMVLTTARFHRERGDYVKQTWARRCTKTVFISDKDDSSLPALKMSSLAEKKHSWSKIRNAMQWAYDRHRNNYDWFLKADDDAFVIMENLRVMLADFKPNQVVYLGHEFSNETWTKPSSFYSGGCGYVLSRGALVQLVDVAFADSKLCAAADNDAIEDVEISRCFQNIGVPTRDTRDAVGRQRFLPLPLSQHLRVNFLPKDFWIWSYDKAPFREGEECCSSLAVAVHYIEPKEMLELEYYIYRLQPFGIGVFSDDSTLARRQSNAYRLTADKLKQNNYLN